MVSVGEGQRAVEVTVRYGGEVASALWADVVDVRAE